MITEIEGEILDNSISANQKVGLGAILRAGLYYVDFAVTVDATGGLPIPVVEGFKIRDVISLCTTANGSGTLTLRKGTTAITNAMPCEVDKVKVRAGTIDDAQSEIAAGSTDLNVISAGAGDRGIITLEVIPI